ncbi:MAG: putative lipid II flippase FtsW [Candidatus Kapabacteria bacterium]|nr:putative lipid II flippase FtsW [Candidatus Kapabacteria bacterium]
MDIDLQKKITQSSALPLGRIDWFILVAIVGLMSFSVAFVYSASSSFSAVKFGSSESLFWKHSVRIVIGVILIFVFARIDYRVYQKIAKPLLLVAIFLLIAVLFVGPMIKGARRWIHIGAITFQPSEYAKFALIIFLAAYMSTYKEQIQKFKDRFLPMLLWIGAVCGLIVLQPNMSTASVIFLIAMTLLFVGGTNPLHLGAVLAVGIVGGGGYALTAQYRLKRILAYLGMGEENKVSEAISYQLDQALIAFANGGFWGVGAGQSRQREWFLPESYGDFIFSVVGEEYGFFGVLIILSAFMLVVWRGTIIAGRAPDKFGFLLASGITYTLGFYAFINAGVTCGLLPTTGLPMPFISYGGTSVFFSAAAVGILLNISAHSGIYKRE